MSKEKVELVREVAQHSPPKYMRRSSQELQNSASNGVRNRSVITLKMMMRRPEKAFLVLELSRSESVVNLQRAFHAKYLTDLPIYNSIMKWYRKLQRVII